MEIDPNLNDIGEDQITNDLQGQLESLNNLEQQLEADETAAVESFQADQQEAAALDDPREAENWGFKAAAKEYLNHAGYRKSKEEGTGVAGRMERNAAVFATFGGDTPVQPVKTDFYVVKPGDTLSKIAKQSGKSVRDLIKVNNLSNPDKLQVGQRLSL